MAPMPPDPSRLRRALLSPGRRVRVGARRLRRWYVAAELTLAKRFGLSTQEDRRFFLLIPAVGVMGGLFAIGVDWLLDAVRALLWGGDGSFLVLGQTAPLWRVLAAPAVGGLLVGLLDVVEQAAGVGAGHGAAHRVGGAAPGRRCRRGRCWSRRSRRSSPSAAAARWASEGPMLRLGAMLASWLGQRLGLRPHRLKILLGCGAAAGMAATYNMPIGGALFAMEVILGNFALEIFGPIVVASVIATLIARAVARRRADLRRRRLRAAVSGWELIAYLGLGVVGAFASVAFVFGVRGGRELFDRCALPAAVAAAGGGPAPRRRRSRSGSRTCSATASRRSPWRCRGAAAAACGCCCCRWRRSSPPRSPSGSGGAGGMFTPSLFVGAMVGGAYGCVRARAVAVRHLALRRLRGGRAWRRSPPAPATRRSAPSSSSSSSPATTSSSCR